VEFSVRCIKRLKFFPLSSDNLDMEMDIAKLATAQKAVELNTAIGVSVLKQAQDAVGAETLALLQAIPQAPSTGNIGGTVDISV